MAVKESILASNAYTAFVVGFAIMTDSMIYTLVLPFLPDLFAGRLHVPERQISKWTALAFEVFTIATLLSNVVVGWFTDASASRSRPFLISVILMVASTVLFFLATTPMMLIASRVIQGASVTFTWVTGLAFLVAQVGEGELGVYVGWTTVGVAIGEIVGVLIGGPVYDYLGHWGTFAVVEALLLADILLRLIAKGKRVALEPQIEDPEEQVQEDGIEQDAAETDTLLGGDTRSSTAGDYDTMAGYARGKDSHRSVAIRLAWNWLGTTLALIIIYMVRGALEVAIPLYLTRQYGWTPTNISLTLLTITLPAAVNPVIGKLTSRQGPRWWSTFAFAICGAAMISFGNRTGHSDQSRILFIAHAAVVGIALAVLINSNQVAISVASQRYGFARTLAKDKDEDLGRVLQWLTPSTMLSGVTTSWSAGVLLGTAFTTLMPYAEDAGWRILCHGLGGLCVFSALGSAFLWRNW